MTRFRQLVTEVHRRSLWQVLSVYLVGSWVALQVVESIGESAGLPDWVQPFALILLIIGLPIVLATAVVQEGVSVGRATSGDEEDDPLPSPPMTYGEAETGHTPAPTAGSVDAQAGTFAASDLQAAPPGRSARRLFTWRNAIFGGAAAFALLGVAVVAYFVMWSTGIGPIGSLAAQGVFEEGDAVVLGDFDNTSNDPALGETVTEALRVDLAGSSILRLVEPSRVQDALGRMGRQGGVGLDSDLAREVAIRDGFKAFIHGTVGSAGSGYIFGASLVAAESGSVLATFRETARGPDEVIDAIDKLSQDIREKAGESLRVIKGEEALEDVTTPSLPALRKYAEAEKLADQTEYERAIASLEEALELDPSFAMAYRKLAVILGNAGGSLARQVEAATRAYELRDRLTERERYLATASYHNMVTRDLDAVIQAYQAILDRFPDDPTAGNNIALALMDRSRLDEAVAAMERAATGPATTASSLSNWPAYLALARRDQEARSALERLETRYPARRLWTAWNRVVVAFLKPDGAEAVEAADDFLALPEVQGAWVAGGLLARTVGLLQMGRIREARQTLDEGLQEMRDLGIWDQTIPFYVARPWLDTFAGSTPIQSTLETIRSGYMTALDSIPMEARGYRDPVLSLANWGDEAGVRKLLDRWTADGGPSSRGAQYRETVREAEALLLLDTNPTESLEALNDLARTLQCPLCSIWRRGILAQELGRLEEARDHFTAALTGGSSDYLGVSSMRVMAHERLAQVQEGLGNDEEAAEHYAIFAEHWADADPELQPRVRQARARAEALMEDAS